MRFMEKEFQADERERKERKEKKEKKKISEFRKGLN